MGLRFRKSVSMGPFRATLSKSGVSFSAGVKGARITKKANGNLMSTIGIPGTGIHYTKEKSIKSNNKKISKKEIEKNVIKEQTKAPENWFDTIPFATIDEKRLFLAGYLAGLFNKYKDGEEISITVEELCIPFKIADINNASMKIDGEKQYTSAHLSQMVNKGWFIREQRGVYKLNSEAIYPYVKKFKEYQEQKEKELIQKVADSTELKIQEKEKKELPTIKKENKNTSLFIRRVFAIISIFFGGGCFGIPSFICKRYGLGIFSFVFMCYLAMKDVDFGFEAVLILFIIPSFSIIFIKK